MIKNTISESYSTKFWLWLQPCILGIVSMPSIPSIPSIPGLLPAIRVGISAMWECSTSICTQLSGQGWIFLSREIKTEWAISSGSLEGYKEEAMGANCVHARTRLWSFVALIVTIYIACNWPYFPEHIYVVKTISCRAETCVRMSDFICPPVLPSVTVIL